MIIICDFLILISSCFFLYNIWAYKNNAEFVNRDEMGTSTTFGIGYAIAIVPLFISLLIYPNLKWWWSMIALSTIFYLPFVLKPIVHSVLKAFKLVDKPN